MLRCHQSHLRPRVSGGWKVEDDQEAQLNCTGTGSLKPSHGTEGKGRGSGNISQGAVESHLLFFSHMDLEKPEFLFSHLLLPKAPPTQRPSGKPSVYHCHQVNGIFKCIIFLASSQHWHFSHHASLSMYSYSILKQVSWLSVKLNWIHIYCLCMCC